MSENALKTVDEVTLNKEEKDVPSNQAIILEWNSLEYALRVWHSKGHTEQIVELSSTRVPQTLDVKKLPEEFLFILINNSRIVLSARQERTIRKHLGFTSNAKVKTVSQFVAVMNLTISGAKAKKTPAFETKIMDNWYPVTINHVEVWDSTFGPCAHAEVTYKIGDQKQVRRLKIIQEMLEDRDDPVHVKMLSEILEEFDLRPAQAESLAKYRDDMKKLEEFNKSPGTILEALGAGLVMNKFLWFDVLTEVKLGYPQSPKLVLVEPALEVTDRDDGYGDSDSQTVLPFVRAFSLVMKKYVYIPLNQVRVKQFANDALDRLHLPNSMREVLIKVFTAPQIFGDMFSGRHGGMVILANGPSGVGKTLTAEVFAEMTKRPLYALEMGELGTNLEQVEASLQRIFARAARWNAVLLFDEADIFLAKRTEEELERSAIVGVFLRLLDQYEGMFFLTTNRAEVIDPAFASRITLRLNYPAIDVEMRIRIWRNMLLAAGITATDEALQQLSQEKDLNGRQIRNQVRLLCILFPNENVLNFEQLSSVLHLTA